MSEQKLMARYELSLQEASALRELITIRRTGGKETYTLQYFNDKTVELVGDRYGRWISVKRKVFDKNWRITL